MHMLALSIIGIVPLTLAEIAAPEEQPTTVRSLKGSGRTRSTTKVPAKGATRGRITKGSVKKRVTKPTKTNMLKTTGKRVQAQGKTIKQIVPTAQKTPETSVTPTNTIPTAVIPVTQTVPAITPAKTSESLPMITEETTRTAKVLAGDKINLRLLTGPDSLRGVLARVGLSLIPAPIPDVVLFSKDNVNPKNHKNVATFDVEKIEGNILYIKHEGQVIQPIQPSGSGEWALKKLAKGTSISPSSGIEMVETDLLRIPSSSQDPTKGFLNVKIAGALRFYNVKDGKKINEPADKSIADKIRIEVVKPEYEVRFDPTPRGKLNKLYFNKRWSLEKPSNEIETSFDVCGFGATICFATDNKKKAVIYTIVLGDNNNQDITLKTAGSPVPVLSKTIYGGVFKDNINYEAWWIRQSVDGISIGRGYGTQTELVVSWTAEEINRKKSNTMTPVLYVGFSGKSCKDNPELGYPVYFNYIDVTHYRKSTQQPVPQVTPISTTTPPSLTTKEPMEIAPVIVQQAPVPVAPETITEEPGLEELTVEETTIEEPGVEESDSEETSVEESAPEESGIEEQVTTTLPSPEIKQQKPQAVVVTKTTNVQAQRKVGTKATSRPQRRTRKIVTPGVAKKDITAMPAAATIQPAVSPQQEQAPKATRPAAVKRTQRTMPSSRRAGTTVSPRSVTPVRRAADDETGRRAPSMAQQKNQTRRSAVRTSRVPNTTPAQEVAPENQDM